MITDEHTHRISMPRKASKPTTSQRRPKAKHTAKAGSVRRSARLEGKATVAFNHHHSKTPSGVMIDREFVWQRCIETLPGINKATWTEVAKDLSYEDGILTRSHAYYCVLQSTYDEVKAMFMRGYVITGFVASWMDLTPYFSKNSLVFEGCDVTISSEAFEECKHCVSQQTDTKRAVICIFKDGTVIACLVDKPLK